MTTDSAAQRKEAPCRRLDGGFVERAHHAAVRVDPLLDLEPELALDERPERAGEAVRPGPRAASELEHVAETARRDQPDPGVLPLEHRVGGGGRAVHDRRELRQRHSGLVERGQHAERLVVGRGRHLRERAPRRSPRRRGRGR